MGAAWPRNPLHCCCARAQGEYLPGRTSTPSATSKYMVSLPGLAPTLSLPPKTSSSIGRSVTLGLGFLLC